jgi:hypothetical protein
VMNKQPGRGFGRFLLIFFLHPHQDFPTLRAAL